MTGKTARKMAGVGATAGPEDLTASPERPDGDGAANRRPTYRLHDGLGYKLSRLSRTMQRRFEAELAPFGISRLAWCVLAAAGLQNIHAPSALADYIGINRTAMSRLLKEMQAAGLIRREPVAGDGRAAAVTLTEKGRAVCEAVRPLSAQVAEHFYAKLTKAEAMALHGALDRLLADEEGRLSGL
jgi:MarR family transcriptional regulator for hemolysin